MQVQKVLWHVLILNIIVAGLKIGLGLFSGILSMVADGFHSFMDSASNVVGLVALRIAQVPPDADHPYGHRKAETLASLFIGVLLAFAAYEILNSAARRFIESSAPQVTAISFGVMIITILINLLAATYEARRGKALQSDILLADAVHTRTDIWVSVSVLGGLVGVRMGWGWLDAAVGLAIAGLIGYSALKVLRKAANVLMDQAMLPEAEIERLALAMPGVESVEHIRSRGRADETYIDLHLRVKGDTSTDYAHSIAHAVQDHIKTAFPQAADVTIHIEPAQPGQLNNACIARQLSAIAHSLEAAAHQIWTYTVKDQFFVELHLEVPSSLTLAEAHTLATRFEARGRAALPTVTAINTHIEPMGETVETAGPPDANTLSQLMIQAQRVVAGICGPDACHDFHFWPEPDALALSMHCTLPPSMSIIDAHTISETIQDALRRQLPQLKRVMVHVEPRPGFCAEPH